MKIVSLDDIDGITKGKIYDVIEFKETHEKFFLIENDNKIKKWHPRCDYCRIQFGVLQNKYFEFKGSKYESLNYSFTIGKYYQNFKLDYTYAEGTFGSYYVMNDENKLGHVTTGSLLDGYFKIINKSEIRKIKIDQIINS